MDEPNKNIAPLQRRTVPGPKMLSEFATQATRSKTLNAQIEHKEKVFTVVKTYIKPDDVDTKDEIFETIKPSGAVEISAIL